MTQAVAWQVLQQAGAPYAYTTYIHLKLNGQFYGLYLFTEDDSNQYLDVRALVQTMQINDIHPAFPPRICCTAHLHLLCGAACVSCVSPVFVCSQPLLLRN